MVVVFLLEHELVARPGQQLGAGALVQQPGQGAAARRVRLGQERRVLDHRSLGGLPPGAAFWPIGRYREVRPVSQGGHVLGPEREGEAGQRPVRVPGDALGQAGHLAAGVVVQHGPAGPRLGELQGDPGQARPRLGERVEDRDRPGLGSGIRAGHGRGGRQPGQVARGAQPRRVAALEGLPPPGQQVQVRLVALDAGDRVVVRAEHQLAPRLVQRRRRVLGSGQPGQGGQPLAVRRRGLRGPLGLLGVDVGHVLAGVHRVHVPGLRGDPDLALGRVLAHRREELRRQGGDEPRPDVALVPVAVDPGDPARRDDVVGADRQQHVAGGRHRGQLAELLVGGLLGRFEGGGGVGHPARAVVVGHVAGQQAAAVRGQPLELGRELHPAVVADHPVRAPLVERAPGPRRLGHPRRRHQPGEGRVQPERVQHPRRARVGAEHLALERQAVDRVADRGLGAGQVRVRLVVGAAHDLDPACLDEREQVRPVLRVRVEVRLEVVDLGQHELVVRIPPGLVEVQPDQLERDPRVRHVAVGVGQEDPGLGELPLSAPPDRVVVEMADHPHGPARLAGADRGRPLGPQGRRRVLRDDGDLHRGARRVRGRDLDPDLDIQAFARSRPGYHRGLRGGHRGALDPDGDLALGTRGAPGGAAVLAVQGHPHDRERPGWAAAE